MRLSLKIILLSLYLVFAARPGRAQLTLSGTVYDSSKINQVEGVRVISTGGLFTITDSLGNFHILVNEKDSVSFYFRNKPTQKFAVKNITDPAHFDISLRITVKGKYSTLKEVVVHSKSYRQDSLENRKTYADVFEYRKPGVRTNISPDGMVGADLDELINIFRFKRNKRLHAFQTRLEAQEKEKYVNYRFNKTLVKRITQLQDEQLDLFMIRYRPSYEFVSRTNELSFYQYVLNCSYQFKMDLLKEDAKKISPR